MYQKNPFLVSTIPSGPAQTCHCFCPAHGRWNSIQNPCRTYCAVPQRLNPPYSHMREKTLKASEDWGHASIHPNTSPLSANHANHCQSKLACIHCLMLPRSAIYATITDSGTIDMTTGTTRGISMYFCTLSPPNTGRTELVHLNQLCSMNAFLRVAIFIRLSSFSRRTGQ